MAKKRINSASIRQILTIYREQSKGQRRMLALGAILIPFSYLFYVVLLPFMVSLALQLFVTHPHDFTGILWIVGAMMIISICSLFTNYFGYLALFRHEEKIHTKLTIYTAHMLMQRSYEFFANHKVGSLTTDAIAFNHSYTALLDVFFLQASSIIVNFIASLVIIGFMAPIMLAPVGLLTIGIVAHSVWSVRERSATRDKRKTLNSKLNGLIADVLGNQILVKVFSREAYETKHIGSERREIEHVANQEIDMVQREAAIRQVILYTFQILIILLCGWLISQGAISIAAIVFIVTYLGRVTGAMFNITGFVRQFEQALIEASPMAEILSQPIEVQDQPGALALTVSAGEVVFNDVSFAYQDNNEEVFSNISLTIKPGEQIGLVGHSGGGKTTLTKLLLRFVDINSGAITIDEQNIAAVTQESLRNHIAYVPQEPFLFHRSLRENIAYGRPEATNEEIMAAVKQANALEFIETLPHGLDTVVGERGVKLSGGQRQRVAIARAILKNAPILVLDEATSALDSESESLIQDALTKLMKGRTSIVIAHRLSTIAKLDRITVLDHGRIVEEGSHSELLAQNGTYAKLWAHQSGGFLNE